MTYITGEVTNSARIFTPTLLLIQIQSSPPLCNGPHFMDSLLRYAHSPPTAGGRLVTTKLMIG